MRGIAARVQRIKSTYGAASNREKKTEFGIIHQDQDTEEHTSSRSFPPPGVDPFTLLQWKDPLKYTLQEKERLEDAVVRQARVVVCRAGVGCKSFI